MAVKETFLDLYNCGHTVGTPGTQTKLHLHNHFELFLFIAGDVQYFVANKSYILEPGDLLLFNSNELHGPKFLSQATYERICLHISPHIIKHLSSETSNLLHCFLDRQDGEQNLIKLTAPLQTTFIETADKLCDLIAQDASFGKDLGIQVLYTQLLIMANQAFLAREKSKPASVISPLVKELIDYIETHLTEPLSLEHLENKLTMDRFALSKRFKKEIGTSIYQYIILRRVAEAKKLLQLGYNVSETCEKTGFNDYANFIRTFKKTTGYSPTNYLKQQT